MCRFVNETVAAYRCAHTPSSNLLQNHWREHQNEHPDLARNMRGNKSVNKSYTNVCTDCWRGTQTYVTASMSVRNPLRAHERVCSDARLDLLTLLQLPLFTAMTRSRCALPRLTQTKIDGIDLMLCTTCVELRAGTNPQVVQSYF